MSNPESFIAEVTEEVRRDQLFTYLRRYGWIALDGVLLLVGGAAWNEWRKARDAAQAQALGDALLGALETPDEVARVTAVAGVAAPGKAAAIARLLAASEQTRAGDAEGAAATLAALAADQGVPQIYRDLATFKRLMVQAATMDPAARRSALDAMAVPGAPFRLLALEQIALADLEAGDTAAALAGLARIVEDAEATAAMRDRAQTLTIALGGTPAPTAADASAIEAVAGAQ